VQKMEDQRLFEYAKNGDLTGVVEVLSKGANINWRNPGWDGQTSLHVASAKGHAEVVKTLLLHPKIDPNVNDDFGWTPLHSASLNSNFGTVKELLKVRHVNYNAIAENGWTALHSASYRGTKEVVDELLQITNIDLHAQTDRGYTFLDIAFERGNSQIINLPSVVEVLLEEVNTLYDQLRISRMLSNTDLAESYRKEAIVSEKLKNIGSQLRDMETLTDSFLHEIKAILLNEKTEFSDPKSMMVESIKIINTIKHQTRNVMWNMAHEDAEIKLASDIKVGISALTPSGMDFDNWNNTYPTTYWDHNILFDGGWEEFKTITPIVTRGVLVTLSIVLVVFAQVVFAQLFIQYYKTRTTKMTFRQQWNIKSLFWTITCGPITWILNRLIQGLTVERSEESLKRFEESQTKLELSKDEAKASDVIHKEMKNHYEDQLKKLHAVYEARIRECKSEFAGKLEEVHSEAEKLKTEMTRMKKKMDILSERQTSVEANQVTPIKRVRSVGHANRHRQDPIIFDKTGIMNEQQKKIV